MMLNVTALGSKKAEDWSGLEKICKRDPVETPKVHLSKLGQAFSAIYGEDILVLIVAVAAPTWWAQVS